jgi:hypothetical protein
MRGIHFLLLVILQQSFDFVTSLVNNHDESHVNIDIHNPKACIKCCIRRVTDYSEVITRSNDDIVSFVDKKDRPN